ncbi:MAG: zinc-ribbon domain-containing protein [Candidatus Sulfotelmatobacter sp.]
MSSQTKHFEGPSTLTPPELNPLLNPLLAQNMGRWAQVYFTSPPEKREQAVQELVRELEAANSTRPENAVAAPSSAREQETEPILPPPSQAPEVQPTLVRCHACGRKNPSTQKFCGMCGTRLGEEAAVAGLYRDDPHGEDLHTADLHMEDQQIDPREAEPARFVQNQESQYVSPDHDAYEPRLNTNKLSLFQSGGYGEYYNDEDAILSTPHSSGSYRVFVGIILAIIIGAAAYIAWRSTQATSQTSHVEPAAPPVATNEPLPTPSSSSKTDTPDRTPPAENQAAFPAGDTAKPVRDEASTRADNGPPALPHGTSRPPKAPPTEALTGTGAEELAVAQGYLNGTNGQGRNSAEAAKWLWKAIAKHNADATLLLSDLYLKGDGVSKNCDQARVLLDTAALKGVKNAGERLRHLQAFGCQ